jgi:hypothetical protein
MENKEIVENQIKLLAELKTHKEFTPTEVIALYKEVCKDIRTAKIRSERQQKQTQIGSNSSKLSYKQLAYLVRLGYEPEDVQNLSVSEASKLIDESLAKKHK